MGSTSPHQKQQQHIVLFPFMSKGHTIPLLQFARILLQRRHVSVTVITTPTNCPFITNSLAGTAATVITIPFTTTTSYGGVESTDELPSMSLFFEFALSTSSMQTHFETALESLPRVSFMVTDGFLWWTLESANKFSVPRFVYWGMSCYSHSVSVEATISGILGGTQPENELVELTQFPWIRICKEDFEPTTRKFEGGGNISSEFIIKASIATQNSYGILVNSFNEMEPVFVDYMNTKSSFKCWCVGPFCLVDQQPPKKISSELSGKKPSWIEWLDEKREEKCSVLYVAFGSQAEFSAEQFHEIAIGLEESMVPFLWVIRKKEWVLPPGFEERVKERGMVVREWVDQREILMHESVEWFLSHCGWNSVLESLCARVPILAWPLMAEQHLNARMVDEEIKVGVRVETCDGSVRGFVKAQGLRNSVAELMCGDRGRQAKRKVCELAHLADVAMKEGGSSWNSLELLLHEMGCLENKKEKKNLPCEDKQKELVINNNKNGNGDILS